MLFRSGRLRQRFEYTWACSKTCDWSLLSLTEYIYDGNRVIQERDVNNTPTVTYTRGPDLSGTMEGAGGIGGLLARSAADANWLAARTTAAAASGANEYFRIEILLKNLLPAMTDAKPFDRQNPTIGRMLGSELAEVGPNKGRCFFTRTLPKKHTTHIRRADRHCKRLLCAKSGHW